MAKFRRTSPKKEEESSGEVSIPQETPVESLPDPNMRARVWLRSAATLVRRGVVYRHKQAFIVVGEENIRAWEADAHFEVTRLS